MKKKLIIFLGIGAFLFLATALIVPLVVDVDRFRPKLVEVANQNLHGKLTLGKLKLSLWGKIKIQAEGLSLEDSQGKKLISVKDVYFRLPLLGVLTGSPSLIIHMDSPDLWVSRNLKGKWNLLEVLPQGSGSEKSSSPNEAINKTQGQSEKTDSTSSMPALLAGARLGLDIRNLHLLYEDQIAKVQTELHKLNIEGKDLSLSRPLSLKIWSELKTVLKDQYGAESFALDGPVYFELTGRPAKSAGAFQAMDLQLKVSLTDLEIEKKGVFHKKKGITAELKGDLSISANSIALKDNELKFHALSIKVNGTAKSLGTSFSEQSGSEKSAQSNQWGLDLSIAIPKTEMKPFADLFPSVPRSGFGGTLEADLKIQGPAQQLGYLGFVRLQEFVVRHQMLKHEVKVDADLSFKTDRMDRISVIVQAPKNKLELKGNLISFQAPQIQLNLSSPGLDLDSLIDFPKDETSKKEKSDQKISEEKSGGAGNSNKGSLDQEMAFMRNNAFLAKSALQLNVDIQSLVSKGALLENLKSQLFFKNLVAGISSLSFKAFSGSVQTKGNLDFKPLVPKYEFSASVSGLDLQKAVVSQMPSLKNTVIGKLSFQASGNGASLDTTKALKNFNLRGNFSIADAQFATIDVAKMASEAIEKSLSKVAEKVPGIKDKISKKLSDRESKYEKMSGSFTMDNGVFQAPDFYAQSAKNQGVDLKGSTKLDLIQQKIDAKWWVIDAWNMTGADSVGFEISGTSIPRVLAEKGQPVQFPVTVGCELQKPCYNYSEVPEHFIKVAVKNSTGAVKERVKQEAKDKAKDILQEKGKDLLKDLKGKFF